MADITNPQAVNFCNNKARILADLIGKLDRTLPQFLIDGVRDFEDNTGGNANGDPIIDGSVTDGRPQVTKLNYAQLKFVAEQLKACLDADDRRELVNNWAVNTQPLF